VIESTFPYEARYLLAEAGGEVRGVLPLFRVHNAFTRPVLLSVPMGVYGGICAEDGAAAASLLEAAESQAREAKAAYVELRHVRAVSGELRSGGSYATFVKDLPDDPGDCLPSLPRKARAAARKAIRDFGLEAVVEAPLEKVDSFFHLFALNKRHLGSPPYPKKLFVRLLEEFGDHATILMVRSGGRDIAGVLTFFYKDTVIPYYSGGDEAYEYTQFNNFMYLRLMELGARRGYRRFDFGRSREGSGSYRFKKHQGFEPTPLHYQYRLVHSDDVPDLTPDNPKFGLPRRIWRRLPLFVVKTLGPRLIRYFP
jgi:FemAB-related protein (PEP-CTERM system-associated)